MAHIKSTDRTFPNVGMGNGNGVPQQPDRIAAHFQDKVLLITGGTGFMAKVLLEKVLRTCDVKKVYLLIRHKSGQDPHWRARTIFFNPLFDLLKTMKGEQVLDKVEAIPGDVTLPGLGISDESRELLANEVNIIYHFAATVRFDTSIKQAVLLNAIGTRTMLELAKECRNLMVFIHASTAYCHHKEKVLYEKAYPPPADPETVIKTFEFFEERALESIKDNMLGDEPNTYSFSKSLAESIAVDAMKTIPVVILRFSVVVPTWKEPLLGWTDNINGPVGLLIAAGKGVLRTMYCDPKAYADFLPVDVAANLTMAFTYSFELNKERRIYNCITSDKNKVTWLDITNIGRDIVTTDMPFNLMLWYPGGSMKRSKLLHWICVILFHYIPALLLDPLIWLSGNQPVLWKVQQRITKAFEVFEYYTNNQWIFDNEYAIKANAWMNETERAKYEIDTKDIDVRKYIWECIHGARLYLLNDSDESIPNARANLNRMWLLDRIWRTLIVFLFLNFVWSPI